MKAKMLTIVAMLLVSLVALSGSVSALSATDIRVDKIELNGKTLVDGTTTNLRSFDRGDKLELDIEFTALVGMSDDLEIEAKLRGDIKKSDKAKVEDEVTVDGDFVAGVSYGVDTMTLEIPERIDAGKTYTLELTFADDTTSFTQSYSIRVDTDNDMLKVDDVLFSPAGSIEAGRALLSTVRVENFGSEDQDDVKVSVAIPELGLKTSAYMDEIEADEKKSSDELFVRIPENAVSGDYEVVVTLEYQDGEEETTQTFPLHVYGGVEKSTGKTTIQVPTNVQTISKGVSATYPITVTNSGTEAKTYTLSVSAPWANAVITPSNMVVVGAGQTSSVNVQVSANDNAVAGENVFNLVISSGNDVLQQVSVKAMVADATSSEGLKRGLEIGLVVLVVLVVILALIIGFNRLKGSDEDGEAGQTYY